VLDPASLTAHGGRHRPKRVISLHRGRTE
jgi:hypothetical protein